MLDYDRGFLLVDDADNLGDELFGICAEQPQFILVNACENSRCRAAGQCRAFGNFPDKVIIGKAILCPVEFFCFSFFDIKVSAFLLALGEGVRQLRNTGFDVNNLD